MSSSLGILFMCAAGPLCLVFGDCDVPWTYTSWVVWPYIGEWWNTVPACWKLSQAVSFGNQRVQAGKFMCRYRLVAEVCACCEWKGNICMCAHTFKLASMQIKVMWFKFILGYVSCVSSHICLIRLLMMLFAR